MHALITLTTAPRRNGLYSKEVSGAKFKIMKMHSNMFGYEYSWNDFADSKQGQIFKENNKEDGEILSLVVPAAAGGGTITFTPVSSGTAAVIDFGPITDFSFTLYQEKPMHQLNKAFGMQDIVIGIKEFDRRYIIKSNNEKGLKQLLSDANLRELIIIEDAADLRILPPDSVFDPRWVIRPEHAVVVYHRSASIDKYDQLDSVYRLLNGIVQQMQQMSLAHDGSMPSGKSQHEPNEREAPRKLHSPLLDRN
jgi:hypothetical protein